MTGVAGPFFAAVALLGAAGVAKVLRPRSTAQAMRSAGFPATPWWGRSLGVAEVVVALAAVLIGGRVTALAVAACYLGFAAFTARLLVLAGDTSCGCFGEGDAPATPVHVALNLAAAVAGALAAGWPTGSLPSFLGDQPWGGAPFLALTALLAWLGYVTLSLLPDLQAASRASGPDGAPTPSSPARAAHELRHPRPSPASDPDGAPTPSSPARAAHELRHPRPSPASGPDARRSRGNPGGRP